MISGTRPRAGEGLAARIPSLVEAWRKARKRNGGGPLDDREIGIAGAALLSLQRGLTGDRRLAGAAYMEDAVLLGAYLLYYWPVSYMQFSIALAERPLSPRRLLDIGSGPGPASAAVLDSMLGRGASQSLDEIILVDASRKALEIAASLLGGKNEKVPRVTTREMDLESGAALPTGPFDLIVMGHCLNELWHGRPDAVERRLELLRRAEASLAPEGRVLLLEPALLASCRDLIAIRDRLAEELWRVIAPCPGSYPCPALVAGPERSCHAESAWDPPEPVASLAAAAGLDRQAVKYAYFLLEPAGRGTAKRPALDAGSPDARRVVSDPMLNKAGRLRYILCGEGKLATISARADDERARRAGFMELKRGDRLRASRLEERPGGGSGFGPGSAIEVLSKAPEAST